MRRPVTLIDRTSNPMKRSVTVRIGELAADALSGEHGRTSRYLRLQLVRAIRLYLHDRGTRGGPGWSYPAFLPQEEGALELELNVDEDLWTAFEEEARRQGASASCLVEHAALYYAAELDAGRITERILDELEREDH
jgi:hypothetical protein